MIDRRRVDWSNLSTTTPIIAVCRHHNHPSFYRRTGLSGICVINTPEKRIEYQDIKRTLMFPDRSSQVWRCDWSVRSLLADGTFSTTITESRDHNIRVRIRWRKIDEIRSMLSLDSACYGDRSMIPARCYIEWFDRVRVRSRYSMDERKLSTPSANGKWRILKLVILDNLVFIFVLRSLVSVDSREEEYWGLIINDRCRV